MDNTNKRGAQVISFMTVATIHGIDSAGRSYSSYSKLGSFLFSQQIAALIGLYPTSFLLKRRAYVKCTEVLLVFETNIVAFIVAAAVVSSHYAFRRHRVSITDHA